MEKNTTHQKIDWLDSSNDKMEWTESDGSVRYLKRQ